MQAGDRKGEAATPEIGALYVDPGHWREGAGGALLLATFAELREARGAKRAHRHPPARMPASLLIGIRKGNEGGQIGILSKRSPTFARR